MGEHVLETLGRQRNLIPKEMKDKPLERWNNRVSKPNVEEDGNSSETVCSSF